MSLLSPLDLPRLTPAIVFFSSFFPRPVELLQNRGGNLSDTTLAYDLPNGRNLNIIKDRQTGLTLWDNERGNGSTYYYHKQPEVESCQALVRKGGRDWRRNGNRVKVCGLS